ncbi:MAG: GMC family oxidoreductase [Polyangiaceae bacterium]|jgi:choline dehydrogenase
MHADTVIVGAGSSGAVIAVRATERSEREVLLLEAGPDYPHPLGLPHDLFDGTRNSMRKHDWGQMHRPRPRSRMLYWFPRGRVVGGSSAVNTCIALRGQPNDYDEWASLGLREWSWAACLPAFRRLENDLDVRNEWHSQDGPLPIRRHLASELVPWQAAFLDACAELGFPRCADSNDPTTTGAGPHAMNKIRGERISVARAYLTPAIRARENLRVRPMSVARRVLFSNRTVVGVEVETLGRVHTINSPRVVLCAGATQTPGILLRSGIGPRPAVERLGVDVVVDLPAVGARLLDHPGAAIFLRPKPGVQSLDHPLIQTAMRYASKGSTRPNDVVLQAGSVLPLPYVTLPLVSLMCSLGKPRGHGTIEFTSPSVRARPRIDSRLFLDAADRACAVEALTLAVELAQSAPMRDKASFFWPPARVVTDKTRLEAWLGRICDSSYHPCGTVPMGGDDASPAEAATDGRGRVRGVEGLWVADASLMPTIPSAHTNLTTIMIGERFGEWAKNGEM